MVMEKRSEEWEVVLSEVMFAYKRSVQNTTGFTLYFIIFGVDSRDPSVSLVGLPDLERTPAVYALQR